MKFNEILKNLRYDIDLNQKELANKLNINPATYRNYENGNREPDFETLISISKFFNVSTDFLLGQSDIRNYESFSQKKLEEPEIPDDEKQLLNSYRKLSSELKAEIRGEIKGILRTSQEQSASLESESSINKKII
ncbi:helix-turn-helix domain-containing protein [Ruminiclostridium papyrosolvens]|uniref:XRE family transcriptional regulator n=1 Tax=Ruminiclostridium papyrosolvens C7 TaxID=1330534 RepID=U4R162_9FIRM|nr:helix-turn-helix transcriptional regulator [Ruminiclostridium papyrosolvens]EPR11943.1 XRE family transcriptional regulator [Ruminiclostridium papyrosolvens C7]